MFNAIDRRCRRCAASVVALAVIVSASGTAGAQSAPSASPDLQGLWDFAMRVDTQSSVGFFALGPVEGGWAGSLTPYATNTLAIRSLTVDGDSVRMVVASREGDVRFRGRLTDNGRAMEGIVDYHGGLRVPMTATRRVRPVVPR